LAVSIEADKQDWAKGWAAKMAGIQIKNCRISNYRTIRNATLDFSEGAVGVIGPNGSGKTNLARALEFFCEVISKRLANTVRGGKAQVPLKALTWTPLDGIRPEAVLADPAADQHCEISGKLRVGEHLIPRGRGGTVNNLSDNVAAHELLIELTVTAKGLETGGVGLVPQFAINIDGQNLKREDLDVLSGVWQQFKVARLQALRPASEFLQAMGMVRGDNIAGRNACEETNRRVLGLSPNFARVDFLNTGPTAVEGNIPDLNMDNMGSGNLRALQLLFAGVDPNVDQAILVHIEEPESHFHPGLQRMATRRVLELMREKGRVVCFETHSPHVLRELYSNKVPVYRVQVVDRDANTRIRQSEVSALPHGEDSAEFLKCMGVDAGFALLGGVLIITDGPTDVPAYRRFFSLFDDLSDLLICFVPIGCLEAADFKLGDIAQLAEHVVVLADGHFQLNKGEELRGKCEETGVTYVQLGHWGVENFFSLDALKKASGEIPGLKVEDRTDLEPMKKLSETPGVKGFSKHHMARIAKHVTRHDLEGQQDFMAVVECLLRIGQTKESA